MEVFPDPEWFARIEAGWAQFDRDLASYTPPAALPAIVAEPVQALPAVSVQVSGTIAVQNNFASFETALRDFLDNKLIRKPQNDQDFADLDLQIKAMKEAEKALNAAEAQMLAQIEPVDTAKRQKDMLAALVKENRLIAEKLLDSEKARRREEKVAAARKAFADHIDSLHREIHGVRLEVPTPDFAYAIKGLKTLASIQDKIDTALANGKIAADQQAADYRAKLAWIDENAAEYRVLLADLQQLIAKPLDDFKLMVTARIEAHKKAEETRLEAERERIRQEEAAKLLAQQQASAEPAPDAIQELPQPQVSQDGQDASIIKISALLDFHNLAEPAPAVSAGQPTPPTLRLGQINTRLDPVSLNAEGLAALGFPHAATDKSAKLYYERDFPRICVALVRHIQTVQTVQTGLTA